MIDVSATGAGDATIAGFLSAVIKDFGPIEALEIANTLGWQNVRKSDALSGIEDWTNTVEMIKDKNRSRNPLAIDDGVWVYQSTDRVFLGPNDSKKHEKIDC